MLRVESNSTPCPCPMMLDPILVPRSTPIKPMKSQVAIFLENPIGIDVLIAFSVCRFFTITGFNQNPLQQVLL